MTTLAQLTIHELHNKLKKKEVSATEITQDVLKRISSYDEKIGSFITVTEDLALAQAKSVDEKISKGERLLPLTGIPLAPKDLYLVEGTLTTAGSHILKEFYAPYSSSVVERCFSQNAVIVGKTNMDEFAMGSSTETSYYKTCHNPWNLNHIPGGSSGGSAAAVSADLCIASLGTDTGGSIRQPASHCSVVGMKPTYGRVSRYGTIAFASSLDQMGPVTKDVEDCAILMNAIAGHDAKDSTSIQKEVPDYTRSLYQNIKGLKVGVPKEFFVEGLHIDVKRALEKALKNIEELGAEIVEVSLPHSKYAVATYYIIAPAEASANLARYDGVRFGLRESGETLIDLYKNTRGAGFGPEVKRRIMIGTFVLSAGYYDAYYLKAQQVRTLIRQDFEKVFENVDVIAGPVTPTTAFQIGEKTSDPLQMYLSDIFTIPANLAGLPAMSVPCGFDAQNMPIGLQLVGKIFDEETLIKVAHAYEQATDWHLKKPEIS